MSRIKKFIVFAIIEIIFIIFMVIGLDLWLDLEFQIESLEELFNISWESVIGDQHEIIGLIVFGIFFLASFLHTFQFARKNSRHNDRMNF